jgi:uncharacterized protein YkwD
MCPRRRKRVSWLNRFAISRIGSNKAAQQFQHEASPSVRLYTCANAMRRNAQRGTRFGAATLVAVALLTHWAAPVTSRPDTSRSLQPASSAPAPGDVVQNLEQRLADLSNRQRTALALRPLTSDSGLSAAARNHSEDMLRRGFFDHVNLNQETPADRVTRPRSLDGRACRAKVVLPGAEFRSIMAGVMPPGPDPFARRGPAPSKDTTPHGDAGARA